MKLRYDMLPVVNFYLNYNLELTLHNFAALKNFFRSIRVEQEILPLYRGFSPHKEVQEIIRFLFSRLELLSTLLGLYDCISDSKIVNGVRMMS